MQIGVAGAGLLGRLLAYQLTKCGHQVTLFDPDLCGKKSAAYVAAGMLAPYAEIDANPAVFQMGLEGITLWQELAHELDQDLGKTPPWLQCHGSIIVAHESDLNELELFAAKLPDHQQQTRLCDRDEILALEPELKFNTGIYLEAEGSVNPRLLFPALNQALSAQSIIWRELLITSVQPQLIATAAAEFKFDLVIDCRGSNGSEHFPNLRLVRGEVLVLHAPEVNISRPVRLLHPRYNLYLVPRAESVYVLGASEIETSDDSPISVRSALELLSACYTMHRGFAEARVLEANVGLRPALPDNLPKIVKKDGLIAVNGLYRHGFLLAPVLVREIVGSMLTRH